jgi:hypothetical protein
MWDHIKEQADNGDPAAQKIIDRYTKITDDPLLQRRVLLYTADMMVHNGKQLRRKELLEKAEEYGIQNIIIDEMALQLLGSSLLFSEKAERQHDAKYEALVDEFSEKKWKHLDDLIAEGDKDAEQIMSTVIKMSSDPVMAKRILLAMMLTLERFGEHATGLQFLFTSELCCVEKVVIEDINKHITGGGSGFFSRFKLEPR